MRREYSIRLYILGTSPNQIADALNCNENPHKFVSAKRTRVYYNGNKSYSIDVTETKNNYYHIKIKSNVMKSLLEKTINFHSAEKRMDRG